jgi:hypothetical protein
MILSEIIAILQTHRGELARRFAVRELAIFGSVARRESTPESDIDVLVAFGHPPGFDGYMALKWRLEELLQSRVDLVMDGALADQSRAVVEAELIRVA